MVYRGRRFVLDVSHGENDVDNASSVTDQPRAGPLLDLIGDIRERTPTAATPPASKPASSTSTGFPSPKSRARQSAFRQRHAGTERKATATPPPPPSSRPSPPTASDTRNTPSSSIENEKNLIDEENRRRLAAMSPAQIQRERAELMSALSPSLIERLLRRANLDDEPQTQLLQGSGTPPSSSAAVEPEITQVPTKDSKSTVSFDVPDFTQQRSAENPSRLLSPTSAHSDRIPSISDTLVVDDKPPSFPPPDLRPASEFPNGPIHFPTPQPRQTPMPNLDPSSPSFLADLQAHYFPETPHDQSSLSWLQTPSRDPDGPDAASAYHPASSASAVTASALRFSLTGNVLSPSTSLSLPTSLGLHHHAADPEAAGYTIPELAILGRSTIPAQRCIAWQVIGRILFRLGKEDFGQRGSDLAEGLWNVIEHEGVVARMLEEAEGADSDKSKATGGPGGKAGIGRHASAKAWALEGVWLWRMGGGGDRGILKEGEIRSR